MNCIGDRGLSTFIGETVVVVIVVSIGLLLAAFFTGFFRTQASGAETAGRGVTTCGGSMINIETVNSSGKTILVTNPTRNRIYTMAVFDDIGAVNTSAGVQKAILSGSVDTLTTTNIPSTGAAKVTVVGFCDGGGTNISIDGDCIKPSNCWPS